MHIAFIDESGDVGLRNSPTRHFVLCAIVIDHVYWTSVNRELCAMRERLRLFHSLRVDAEIHASEFLGGSPLHLGLDFRRRFQCALHILRTLRKLPGVTFARAAVAKTTNQRPVLDVAWDCLLSHLSHQIQHMPARRCPSGGLLIICDHHTSLPYRPSEITLANMPPSAELLDLPLGRDTKDNLTLQAADLLAYLTKQHIEPGIHFSRSRGRALVRECDQLFTEPCSVIIP